MIKQKRGKCTFLRVVTGGGLFGHCKFVVVSGKWTKWKIDVWIIKILNLMVKIINFLVCLCLHNNLTDKMIWVRYFNIVCFNFSASSQFHIQQKEGKREE